MQSITIPSGVEEARSRLDALDGIATAVGWERAAIVWAFVEPDTGNPSSSAYAVSSDRLSARDFAGLGIAGLRSHVTVLQYWQAWQGAIDAGQARAVEPGQAADLPDVPWPPTRRGTDGYASRGGAVRTVERIVEKHGPDVLGQAIADSPQVAKAARAAIRDRDRLERAAEDEEVAAAGRAVSRNISRALGDDSATTYVRQAAALLASAGIERSINPPEDEAKFREALALVRRYLDVLDGGEPPDWSDADRSFLAEMGVKL